MCASRAGRATRPITSGLKLCRAGPVLPPPPRSGARGAAAVPLPACWAGAGSDSMPRNLRWISTKALAEAGRNSVPRGSCSSALKLATLTPDLASTKRRMLSRESAIASSARRRSSLDSESSSHSRTPGRNSKTSSCAGVPGGETRCSRPDSITSASGAGERGPGSECSSRRITGSVIHEAASRRSRS